MNLLKRLILPLVLFLLALGLWNSGEFQQVAAGVAIFLFGMLSLEQGFRAFSGGMLERILQRSTNRLWKSLSFGVVSTSIMQSSSLVSILTISFLSAGLIPLAAGLGIIFGANLGTTTGAWLIAGFGLKIKLASYAMPLLVFGVALMFQNQRNLKGIGQILAGLGFLFLGIHHMKEGFADFQQSFDLSVLNGEGLSGQLLYIAIGLAATVVMQSSHATLVLILTALGAGHIAYLDALALAIGANIGTTITALLGSVSANTAGKQLAFGHLLFNLITGLLALFLLPQLLLAVEWLALKLQLADDNYTLRLALFHSLFNTLGILVMLPLLKPLERTLVTLLPENKPDIKRPKYLNDAALSSSAGAYQVAQKESARLYRFSRDIIVRGLGWHSVDFRQKQLPRAISETHEISRHDVQHSYEIRLKQLHSAIIRFLTLARQNKRSKDSERLRRLSAACFHVIEAVKGVKHMQTNLFHYLSSDNQYMADAYQGLRNEIAGIIIAIENIHKTVEENADNEELNLEIEHQQLLLQRRHEELDSLIDSLIRQQKISATMATSLMSDKQYMYRIAKNLLKAARQLFSPHDLSEEIQLEENELDAINRQLEESEEKSNVSSLPTNSLSGPKQ